MRYALRSSQGLFVNISESLFEECDPALADKSIPSNLKLLEGILKSDPENREILRLLSMGFCGYSMLFIEKEDPERAADLYYRAFKYGLRALKYTGNPAEIDRNVTNRLLERYEVKNAGIFLWTTVSWNLWINNNLDNPAAISQIGLARLFIDKIAESDPELFYGLPYIMKAVSLSARSPLLGGNYDEAEHFFKKAVDISKGRFLLSKYYYARYYCVSIQKKELFISLLNEIIDDDAQALNEICLINRVIQEKARTLLDEIDEYFF
ncbi:TRAP transporter TatT component family protein [Thermodesulfobacteriota bacterium]